jgi:fucose permease
MRRNYFIVGLILLIFFVISLLTNILGPLIPDIILSFHLRLALAGLLPFSFFIAYGIMSIPAGILVEKYHEKPVLVASFVLAFAGSLLFAVVPQYWIALISLFMIGIGMAMLQVAINPLLRVSGGEEHFAFFSVMGQLIFGLASFISPHIYSYLVQNLTGYKVNDNSLLTLLSKVVPPELPWVSLYWIFAAITVAMIVILSVIRFPQIELKESEKIGVWGTYKELLNNKIVILYFFGIFAYVGSEQGVANWISKFLNMYFGLNPQVEGASTVSYFWGLMTAGCVVGLLLLKLMDSRHVLVIFVSAAFITLTFALFGTKIVSSIAFPMIGFFASVMWSVVFSLALNSVDRHHGSFSGILCMGIIGGAVVPLLIGWLGDIFGLRIALFVLYVTFGYLLSIGFWSKPLIANATIFGNSSQREKKTEKI